MGTLKRNVTLESNEKLYDPSSIRREFAKSYMVEKFWELMNERNFSEIKKMLDEGFHPNTLIPMDEREYYSYDNGLITGVHEWVEYYRLLDLCEDCPALQKLLRHYGAKTSREISAEREAERKRQEEIKRQKRDAEEKARIEKEMEEVNKLLG